MTMTVIYVSLLVHLRNSSSTWYLVDSKTPGAFYQQYMLIKARKRLIRGISFWVQLMNFNLIRQTRVECAKWISTNESMSLGDHGQWL
jgi:hypothetical protein